MIPVPSTQNEHDVGVAVEPVARLGAGGERAADWSRASSSRNASKRALPDPTALGWRAASGSAPDERDRRRRRSRSPTPATAATTASTSGGTG